MNLKYFQSDIGHSSSSKLTRLCNNNINKSPTKYDVPDENVANDQQKYNIQTMK